MRKSRFAIAALVPVVALAVAMSAAGGAKKAAAATASCYPGHEFTIWDWTGAFNVTSTGSAAGNGGDVSWTLSTTVKGNRPSTADFAANPGSLDGSLDATVHVPGVGHTVHFSSHCISTAELGPGGVYVIFEGVVDLPWWSGGDKTALIELFLNRGCRLAPRVMTTCNAAPALGSTPVSGVNFFVTHGTTCAQNDPTTDFGFNGGNPSGSFKGAFKGGGNTGVRGRAGLPAGVPPSGNPCPGLFYD